MRAVEEFDLIHRRYRDVFGASLAPSFSSYMHRGCSNEHGAALGYKRAGDEPLFLEAYLDEPVEEAVSHAVRRPVSRDRIVEIGNFAADNVIAMVSLWGAAANDFAGLSEYAVATLTQPLRRMFSRIGVPVIPVASALPERLPQGTGDWGSYYQLDPWVCTGNIAEGQNALTAFLRRRQRVAAA